MVSRCDSFINLDMLSLSLFGPSWIHSMNLVGQRIRNINVLSSIGEGGMGAVYLGYDEALQRNVALKVLRAERIDERNRARLLREARILSQLEHPLICRIHDFLQHQGLAILVLEYVRGETLSKSMARGIDGRAAFRIARQVTEVLAAAHSTGVIHRDLKPDNVMCTPEGSIKVLDFGLARSLSRTDASIEELPDSGESDEELDEATLRAITRFGSVVGTVAYMSPEQARGESLTTASDMYSLGVLFHELFSGAPAYDPDLSVLLKLKKVGNAEVLPVHGVETELADLIRRLESLLPDDRPRAADVLHRLRWIEARPRRRRRRLMIAAATTLMLLIGGKYTFDLSRQQQRTLAALGEAERARLEAQQVSDFMVDVFKVSDPGEASGNRITAREILDRGAERLEEELDDQPAVRGRLIGTVGRVYLNLGLYQEATEQLEESLLIQRDLHSEPDLSLARALYEVAYAYYMQDRYPEATALFEESLAMRRELLPASHPDIANCLEDLGRISYDQGQLERALQLLEEAVTMLRSTADIDDLRLATALWTNAVILNDRGDFRRSEQLFRESVQRLERLSGNRPTLASVLESFGALYLNQGRFADAEPLFRRSLEIRERVLDRDHPNLAISASYLAIVSHVRGELDEAEQRLLQATAIFERALGADHFNTGASLVLLADLYLVTGRWTEAADAYRRSRSIWEQAGLHDNYNALTALAGLADARLRLGELESAEQSYRAALDGWERTIGTQTIDSVKCLVGLAEVMERREREDEAEVLWLEALSTTDRLVGEAPDNPESLTMQALLQLRWGARQGNNIVARELYNSALETVTALPGAEDEIALAALTAEALLRLGERRRAAPLIRHLDAAGWVDPELDALWQR